MSNDKFRVYFVRHGETDWNRTRKLQGQLDVPLNQTGLKQSLSAGRAFKEIPFARAFSSDLQRATQTAECILRYQSNLVLETDESLRERYYLDEPGGGTLPGSDKQTPSTETIAEFSARCLAWYARSIERYMTSSVTGSIAMEQPHSILVVSHGGWILTLLTALQTNGTITCGDGVELGYCLNTGVSVVEYTDVPCEGKRSPLGVLVRYSGVEHLAHDNLTFLEVNEDVIGDAWRRP